MRTAFDVAVASVLGSDHARVGRNNQDAALVVRGDRFLLGVVSDGCGSCHRSEVGAVLATRLVARWVPQLLLDSPAANFPAMMEVARKNIVFSVKQIADAVADLDHSALDTTEDGQFLGGGLSADWIVSDCFLATIVGFFATDEHVVLFRIGDGYTAVNGAVGRHESKDNAPAYPAYDLLTMVDPETREEASKVAIEVFPTQSIDRLMVATDGVRHIEEREYENVPGKSRPVGGLEQLWADEVFLNPFRMGRSLSMLNHDVVVPDWAGQSLVTCPSILKDDTTVISIRRRA